MNFSDLSQNAIVYNNSKCPQHHGPACVDKFNFGVVPKSAISAPLIPEESTPKPIFLRFTGKTVDY